MKQCSNPNQTSKPKPIVLQKCRQIRLTLFSCFKGQLIELYRCLVSYTHPVSITRESTFSVSVQEKLLRSDLLSKISNTHCHLDFSSFSLTAIFFSLSFLSFFVKKMKFLASAFILSSYQFLSANSCIPTQQGDETLV